jgi:hypothetical protein
MTRIRTGLSRALVPMHSVVFEEANVKIEALLSCCSIAGRENIQTLYFWSNPYSTISEPISLTSAAFLDKVPPKPSWQLNV